MFCRNESFCDGLGLEIEGGVPTDLRNLMFFKNPPPLPHPPPGNLNFCIFHLGTSSAYSATQRYRFVHGHVHILTLKAWGPQFLHFSLGDL